MTPMAPASERRVVDCALMRVAARARGIARGAANERGALARKAWTSTLASRMAHPTVRAAERGIVSAVERVDKVERCVEQLGLHGRLLARAQPRMTWRRRGAPNLSPTELVSVGRASVRPTRKNDPQDSYVALVRPLPAKPGASSSRVWRGVRT